MQNGIIYLTLNLAILFLSCNQQSRSSIPIVIHYVKDSIPTDTAGSQIDYISGIGNRWENFVSIKPSLLPEGTVFPFTGKIKISDFPKYGFILDTLGFIRDSMQIFYNRIYGLTLTNYFIYNYITPEHENNELLYYDFSGDTVLVPFRYDVDQEGTIITRWKKSGADSLEYLDYFKTPFATKNSRLELLEVTKHLSKYLMIGKTHFGEGGENGEELWFARILNDNRLKISYLTSCGWNFDSDTIRMLQYEKIKEGINVYEYSYQIDSKTGLASNHLLAKQSNGSFKFDDF